MSSEENFPSSSTQAGGDFFSTRYNLRGLMASGTNFESILCEGNDAEIIYYDDKPAAQIQQPKPARKPEPAPVVLEGREQDVDGRWRAVQKKSRREECDGLFNRCGIVAGCREECHEH